MQGVAEYSGDDYFESITDSYEKFWYYLEEKAAQPTKRGPFTREEMMDMKNKGIIEDITYVWHPCIGTWLIAAHACPLYKSKKGIL